MSGCTSVHEFGTQQQQTQSLWFMMMLSVVVRDSLSVPITRQAFLDISAAGLFLPGLVQQGHRKPVQETL